MFEYGSAHSVKKKKILYISGSIGLGHASKDLAIAQKLRELNPLIDITWLAANPADLVLEKSGQKLHPQSKYFSSYSAAAEGAASGAHLNLVNYVLNSSKGWIQNVQIFRRIIAREKYDLVVGNETYEILIGLVYNLFKIDIPFVLIYDFLGLDTMTGTPIERIGKYVLNWTWSQDRRTFAARDRLALFVGEPYDIPNTTFGRLLPNRREHAKKHYTFIGYIIRFDPDEYFDKSSVRKKLGYGEQPLIVCSIGGTSIGRGLLELCSQAYPLIKKKMPHVHMVLVTGPRVAPDTVKVQPGVEVKGYVPKLFQHYAASDLSIVQGGFSSTLELAALRRPFIFFPIEGHSEQQHVADRLARYNAGIKLYFSQTTPESLAACILQNIGTEVPYKTIKTDGAQRAACILNKMLNR